MEILRFEEAPTNAPKRKKSSRGFIALGFVATLFGVSTAFASSTIQINSTNTIALGQGVSVFTTCDTEIGVEPQTRLNNDVTAFSLKNVKVGSTVFGGMNYLIDDRPSPDGCLGTDFVIKFYDSTSGTPTTPVDVCLEANGFDGVSHTIDTTVIGSLYECKDNAIYFRVAASSHDIDFDRDGLSNFFDRISLETTTYTYPAL